MKPGYQYTLLLAVFSMQNSGTPSYLGCLSIGCLSGGAQLPPESGGAVGRAGRLPRVLGGGGGDHH